MTGKLGALEQRKILVKMGTITSKDTRRISFDNTLALNSALNIQKSIADDDDDLEAQSPSEVTFKDPSNYIKLHEEEQDYWAHRIEYLKNEHQIINKIIETEYAKTIENTNILFDIPKITEGKIKKNKKCSDWREKMLKCYEDYPRQPLMCSAIVQAFTNCVASYRLED